MTSTKMTCKKWTIVSLFAATVLICVPAAGQSKTAPGRPTQSVLVVNGSGQPVPTTAQGTTNVAGTVNIGNAPSVNVANTPSVNVANTPTVNLAAGGSVGVTNPPDSQNNPTPLAVLEATQPYDDGCVIQFSGAGFGSCFFRDIPSGKRLVIQEVDAVGIVQPGVKPVYITAAGSGFQHNLTATFMGSASGSDWFATHQETHLYLTTAVRPYCLVQLSASSSGTYNCQFSGFLVDVP